MKVNIPVRIKPERRHLFPHLSEYGTMVEIVDKWLPNRYEQVYGKTHKTRRSKIRVKCAMGGKEKTITTPPALWEVLVDPL